ncbi:uncharacterized protein [Cicer arietinum]|uniref:uncharacterized protein n=1 Tax=Cicer arietinum TaxID=3827 RepID=UPI003CC67832
MGKSPFVVEVESSTLVTKNEDGKRDSTKPWCEHCKRPWNTRDTCWKLHGKPLNWKKKNEETKVMPSKLRGNFPNTALLSVTPSHTWIIDSGATDHMTGESSMFSSYSPCAGNHKITIADGSLSVIARKCSVILSPVLTLKDILHVPNLSCNLLSITKLTKDINCQANFFHSHCTFKDLSTGKIIGNAKESGGLYYLDNRLDFKDQQKMKRNNKHLLEVAKALLFANKVPKYLWDEVVLTASYLINRMPSKVLDFHTPLDVFRNYFPLTSVSADLPLKVFDCTAFVRAHKQLDKIETRAIKCVVTGYSPTQKGYRCFEPKSKRIF